MVRSVACKRSTSPSRRRAAVTLPGGGTRRRIALPVIDLPDPDSPTRPTFSRPRVKLMPRTASTSPVRVGKETRKSSTVRSGASISGLLGVEHVAQAVAEQVETEAHDENGDPRHGRDPPLIEDELPPRGDHRPPFRERRLCAEAEEAEPGGGEDDARHVEGHAHDERRGAERHDVAPEDPRPRRAGDARGRDELAIPDGERLRS